MDNEAACAALATGAAMVRGAILVVYAPWAIAAQGDMGLRMERVPTEVYPANLPSRYRGPSFAPEPAKELAPPSGHFINVRFFAGATSARKVAFLRARTKPYPVLSRSEPWRIVATAGAPR